ncbi:MAG: hypothetical protein JW871_05660, partial [Endomicrobiales bacterium]|nr:hypothetical protein [Endomicrobiales bacterium]
MSRFVLNRLIWRFSRVTRRILRYVLTLNFKKIVAFITLSCFLFTFVLAQSLQAAVNKIEENMKLEEIGGDFFLPYSIGHITDAKYFAESDKVVINIQDLHCHPEVQLNISKAIAILDEKYGLKKVFVEGAIGEVDTSWLASIKDKEFKQKLVDLLINQGKLTGAEHYSISSGKPGLLAGLEDERIYKENIIRLDSILNESPWIELILYNMQKEVDDLKDRYYDSKHKGFEKLVSSYRNGGVEAGGFYRKLNGYTEKLDINLENYRNISLYLKMVRLRKNLNHNKINRELYGLIEVLKEKLPYKVYKSLDDSLKKYSEPDDVYLYIDRIIHEFDLKIETKFPNLKEFLEYVKLSQEVNPIELVSEENILLQKINIKLSKSQAEKEVVILDGLFKYYSSYYTNKISNKEYEYFREHSDDFKALWRRYIGVGSISQFERISDLFD